MAWAQGPSTSGGWTALLGDARAPLADGLGALAAHSAQIERGWGARLDALGVPADELDALAVLRLDAHAVALGKARFEAYALALEKAGERLALRGIPETRAVAALSAYLESALPYLVGAPAGPQIAALCRLALVGALCVTTGYANARAASWRSFGEQERHRLSRDLHDEVGHQLVVLKMYLGMISAELGRARPARIRARLEEAAGLVSQALHSVRRLILDLGPAALEGVGFVPALKLYARQFAARTGVRVRVRDDGVPPALPRSHQAALYRLLQGALSNVVKHARARQVRVRLEAVRGAAVGMTIEDDGIGFDTAAPRQAFGLAAMRDRVAGLGGRLRVQSRPVRARGRHGTRIEVELPLPEARPR
jgi:signal transduction histidine kinase